jgi:hypothetical protein
MISIWDLTKEFCLNKEPIIANQLTKAKIIYKIIFLLT